MVKKTTTPTTPTAPAVRYPTIGVFPVSENFTILPDRSVLFNSSTYNPLTGTSIIAHAGNAVALRDSLIRYDNMHLLLDWAEKHNLHPVKISAESFFAQPLWDDSGNEKIDRTLLEGKRLAYDELRLNTDLAQTQTARFPLTANRRLSTILQNIPAPQHDIDMLKNAFAQHDQLLNPNVYFVHENHLPRTVTGNGFSVPYGTPYVTLFATASGCTIGTGFFGSLKKEQSWRLTADTEQSHRTAYQYFAAYVNGDVSRPTFGLPGPRNSHTQKEETELYRFYTNTPEATIAEFRTQNPTANTGGEQLWNNSTVIFTPISLDRTPHIFDITTPPQRPPDLQPDALGVPQWSTETIWGAVSNQPAVNQIEHIRELQPRASHPSPGGNRTGKGQERNKTGSVPLPYRVEDFGYSPSFDSHLAPNMTVPGTPPSFGSVENLSCLTTLSRTLILHNHLVTLYTHLISLGYVPLFDKSLPQYSRKPAVSADVTASEKILLDWVRHLGPSHGEEYPLYLDFKNWNEIMTGTTELLRQWRTLTRLRFFLPQHVVETSTGPAPVPVPAAPYIVLFPHKLSRTSKSRRRRKSEHYLHIIVAGFYHNIDIPACICLRYNTDPLLAGPAAIVPTPLTVPAVAGDGTPLFPTELYTFPQYQQLVSRHVTPDASARPDWSMFTDWARHTDCEYVHGCSIITSLGKTAHTRR